MDTLKPSFIATKAKEIVVISMQYIFELGPYGFFVGAIVAILVH